MRDRFRLACQPVNQRQFRRAGLLQRLGRNEHVAQQIGHVGGPDGQVGYGENAVVRHGPFAKGPRRRLLRPHKVARIACAVHLEGDDFDLPALRPDPEGEARQLVSELQRDRRGPFSRIIRHRPPGRHQVHGLFARLPRIESGNRQPHTVLTGHARNGLGRRQCLTIGEKRMEGIGPAVGPILRMLIGPRRAVAGVHSLGVEYRNRRVLRRTAPGPYGKGVAGSESVHGGTGFGSAAEADGVAVPAAGTSRKRVGTCGERHGRDRHAQRLEDVRSSYHSTSCL